MSDDTAAIRKFLIETGEPQAALAAAQQDKEQTWDTTQLQADFEVLGYMAPYVTVRRRSDGQLGSLEFTHSPRVYFGFKADS